MCVCCAHMCRHMCICMHLCVCQCLVRCTSANGPFQTSGLLCPPANACCSLCCELEGSCTPAAILKTGSPRALGNQVSAGLHLSKHLQSVLASLNFATLKRAAPDRQLRTHLAPLHCSHCQAARFPPCLTTDGSQNGSAQTRLLLSARATFLVLQVQVLPRAPAPSPPALHALVHVSLHAPV